MSVVFRGVAEAIAGVEHKVAAMHAASRLATGQALHLIERNAKAELTTSSHRADERTPSMPGEPPSLVTGNLRRSITVTGPTKVGPAGWRGQVGPTAIYGRIQELGGRAGRTTLPARPYLAPAFAESLPEIRAIFKRAYTTAILK